MISATAAVEFWTALSAPPSRIAARALALESAGWDGLFVSDSQCLLPEAFVLLAAAAAGTRQVRLAPFAANPVTRHPSVTAGAVATLHALSGHRAVLGLGRGDSALAHLGRPPVRVAVFERFLADVQVLLRGGHVPLDDRAALEPASSLPLVAAPSSTSLTWLDPSMPKVPVAVMASGPRVMRLAGRHADEVVLAIGADPRRVSWAIDVTRRAAVDAGREPGEIGIGLLLTVAPFDDTTTARRLAAGSVASLARFATMHGQRPAGPVSDSALQVYERLASGYDMTQHAQHHSPQIDALTDEFVDDFALIGSPAQCAERVRALAACGVTRFVLGPPAVEELVRPKDAAEAALFEQARTILTGEVLPLARDAVAG